MMERYELKHHGRETGPSTNKLRRSLSSVRLGSPDSIRYFRDDSFILQDSLEHARAEIRDLRSENRDLRSEIHRLHSNVDRFKSDLRECYRRERLVEEVRTLSREEGYRNGVTEYRQRMIQLFPNIDQSYLPYYVGPDGVPRY